MGSKQAYKEKLEAEIRQWDARIDQWKAKAQKTKTAARTEVDEQIQSLMRKRDDISKKMQQLKNIGDDKWENLRKDIDKSWQGMKDFFDNLTR